MTGSQPFLWMAGVLETPAGRVGIINLPGLSHRETLGEGEKSTPFLPLSDAIQDFTFGFVVRDLCIIYAASRTHARDFNHLQIASLQNS